MAEVESAAAPGGPLPDTAAEAVTVQPTAAAAAPHMLERKWAFWFDNQSKPKQGAAWGSSLRKAYTFDTVEEFWSLYEVLRPSKFPANADFHCFKAGIEPKWEDPENASGGKWSVTSTGKANLDAMWLETLMALIGEQFEESDEICGVVANVRQRQDKIALWTKRASNEAVQEKAGRACMSPRKVRQRKESRNREGRKIHQRGRRRNREEITKKSRRTKEGGLQYDQVVLAYKTRGT